MKFTDLDLKRKTQLVLNLRIQSMLAQYICGTQDIEMSELLDIVSSKAGDEVFNLSESELDICLKHLDNKIEEYVRDEKRGYVAVELD